MSGTYKWMAGPRYLCRKRLVLRLVEELKPASILEIGFGAGDLLETLSRLGYGGLGVDFSEDACRSLAARTAGTGFRFRLANLSGAQLAEAGERFSLVMAFEVLEHIRDDEGALRGWHRLLTPGGRLLLSVPAHMGMWGAADVFAGHVRRYEKAELQARLAAAGFRVEKFYSYGYPLMNLVGAVKNLVGRLKLRGDATEEQRTKESGQGFVVWSFGKYLINDLTMLPAYLLQDLFLDNDLGNGYLVLAEKVE